MLNTYAVVKYMQSKVARASQKLHFLCLSVLINLDGIALSPWDIGILPENCPKMAVYVVINDMAAEDIIRQIPEILRLGPARSREGASGSLKIL